jgi:hypothetical protein
MDKKEWMPGPIFSEAKSGNVLGVDSKPLYHPCKMKKLDFFKTLCYGNPLLFFDRLNKEIIITTLQLGWSHD